MSRFSPVASRASFAQGELEIIKFWRSEQVFQKGLAAREGAPEYVFYEGPPTANGRPGIHHVLARAYKDLFPRYMQMKGYRVDRKAGWDTHGLPVELEIEKKIKVSGKKQIEEYGIGKFNALCRKSASEYIEDWERLTERIGFWLDTDNPYRTYDSTYIESVWWSLRQLWDRKLLYQGYKVVPYCPRCQTSLSSHELSLGYRDDTEDPSVYVKFELKERKRQYLLAWTTTPWTLPGNVALAVHPDEEYVRVAQDGDELILARARISELRDGYELLETFKGSTLVRLEYRTLFEDVPPEGPAFAVLPAPAMVTMSEGTGVVHTAGAYGVADLELCQREGIALRHVVGLDGRFVAGQTRYGGQFVKDADKQIIKDLRESGNLYAAGTVRHTYPFCWRCESPLLYFALTSWFIKTTAVKEKLLRNNKAVKWYPAHIRDGRMGDWLENLVDWNISRTRYWGTPLPIWECGACGKQHCVGSSKEIGLTVADDLHRPFIDGMELGCECGGTMVRVPDVIDCWYDSGAMPFAQHHYPFENKELFASRHPADFICEAIDQTRGWFFSLLAVSTLLFDKPAYRNTVCLGLVLDEKGQKMSKSRNNTVDPLSLVDEFGADATRWYFYSAVSPGSDYRVGKLQIQDVVRRFMLTLWNVYSFHVTYANLDGFDPRQPAPVVARRPALDRWCLARLAQTIDTARDCMDRYDPPNACRAIELFVEDLSKWYVRRSRRRFWKSNPGKKGELSDLDKLCAYSTLQEALLGVAGLIAPMMPFLAERMYRNLSGLETGSAQVGQPVSIHLTEYPEAVGATRDPELVGDMERVRHLVEDGLAAREAARIKVRQPLASATVGGEPLDSELEQILADELNVRQILYGKQDSDRPTVILDTELTDELILEGVVREMSRKVNDLRKGANLALDDRIRIHFEGEELVCRAVSSRREHLQAETLADGITEGRAEVLGEWEGALAGSRCWIGIAR